MTSAAKAVLVGFALVTAPELASACDACLAAQDDSVQQAFLIGTGLLSFLPLVMIGSGVWWLRRRAQKLAAEEAAGVIHLPLATRTSRRA